MVEHYTETVGKRNSLIRLNQHFWISDAISKGWQTMGMAARIGPRRPRRIYLAEWREHRGLSQKQLGERLDVADMTVSRWERGTALLNTNVMAALAEALSIEPQDLYHHPDRPTADELLRDQPLEIQNQAIAILRALRRA